MGVPSHWSGEHRTCVQNCPLPNGAGHQQRFPAGKCGHPRSRVNAPFPDSPVPKHAASAQSVRGVKTEAIGDESGAGATHGTSLARLWQLEGAAERATPVPVPLCDLSKVLLGVVHDPPLAEIPLTRTEDSCSQPWPHSSVSGRVGHRLQNSPIWFESVQPVTAALA